MEHLLRRPSLIPHAVGVSLLLFAGSPRADSTSPGCLPTGDGFLRARLSGALTADLDWSNDTTTCVGSVRPAGGGLRVRFSHRFGADQQMLVLLFGIPRLREGQSARALPVNVTVIREGDGEFYGTQGEDKCTLDEIHQEPLAGIPLRTRSYKVVARGFCTEPARSLSGAGSVLITRFDYAGRVDFSEADEETQAGASPDAK